MTTEPTPLPFLELRVHDLGTKRTGACVGYELNDWRYEPLCDHMMEWLPEFALTYADRQALKAHSSVALMRKAARAVYKSKKFQKRGEFGELLLHILIRQAFGTLPAISKITYKAPNDPVKGFDAVHVVVNGADLELWLGEAKLYDKFAPAVAAAVKSLTEHCSRDYMREEFAVLENFVDPAWPQADDLRALLNHRKSLDEVFKRVCIPVLLTYDSPVVGGHTSVSPAYVQAFEDEVKLNADKFFNALNTAKIPTVKVHLFLVPLHTKKTLVPLLDRKLKTWQAI